MEKNGIDRLIEAKKNTTGEGKKIHNLSLQKKRQNEKRWFRVPKILQKKPMVRGNAFRMDSKTIFRTQQDPKTESNFTINCFVFGGNPI